MTPHEILTVIVSAIGVIAAVVTGFIGYQNGLRKNSSSDGEARGVLMTEIGYIKAGIDDIKKQQERQEREQNELLIRMSTVENDQKTMWKRIDELKNEEKMQWKT